MRRFSAKTSRVSTQNDDARLQVQRVISVRKSFQEPSPEETGAASDEKVLPAKRLPDSLGVSKHIFEIVGERVLCGCDGGHF